MCQKFSWKYRQLIYEHYLERSYDTASELWVRKHCVLCEMFDKLDVLHKSIVFFVVFARLSKDCRKIFCKSGPATLVISYVSERRQRTICRYISWLHATVILAELCMGWVDPWVGLGRDFFQFLVGWVGSTIAKSTKNFKGLF